MSATAWIAAAVLLVAGTGKLRAPAATGQALRHLGLSARLAIPLGGIEIVLGASALLTGHPLSHAAVGVAYVVLAVAAYRLASRTAACGCFGSPSTPSTITHVVVDVVAAGAAVAAGVSAVGSPLTHGLAALAIVPPTLLAAWLVSVLLGDAADLAQLTRRSLAGGAA